MKIHFHDDNIISQFEGYENLKELDTESLDASFSTLDGGTPLREDTPRESNDIAKNILSHAPQAKDDFFIVPAIIE